MEGSRKTLKQYTTKKHERYIFLFQALGTFLFSYAIGCSHPTIITTEQNFVHCFSILLALALAGQVSGGYFNSTLTIAAYANKRHRIIKTYLLAQVLGGLAGTLWCWLITGRIIVAYQHQTTLEMIKYVINQFVGSFFFSICVLALTNKFTTHAYKSWQIYISIAASLYLVRKMTGDTSLNPTATIFFQIGSWIKTSNTDYLLNLWVLIVPSTIGGLLGGLFMHKIYQPLLLFIKFKNQDFQNINNDSNNDNQKVNIISDTTNQR